MKRVMFSCLVAWLLSTFALPVTDEQPPGEPPAPKPSAAVQKILDEATQSVQAKRPQDALKATDRALAAARETKDLIGEALAHRSQALTLQDLVRTRSNLG